MNPSAADATAPGGRVAMVALAGEPGATRVRIAYLDSLRGLAALIVAVFWHYQHFSNVFQPNGPPLASAPFYGVPVIRVAYQSGRYAVDFFFILSGIIFSYVYWDTIGSGKCSWREYAAVRFARLYPIHIFALLLITPLLWAFYDLTGRYPIYHHNNLTQFIINLLFLQGGFTHVRNSFNGPAWSLSVEAFLYVIFFVLASRQAGAGACVAMLAVGAAILASGANHAFLLNSYIGRGLVGFALGMIIYRAGRRPDREMLLAGGLVVAAAALSLLHGRIGSPRIANLFAACALGATLIATRRVEILQRVLEVRALIVLGDLSLAVYMIHMPLQCAILLAYRLAGRALPYSSPWFLVGYGASVIAAAWLVHRYYEAPARAYLRRRLMAATRRPDSGAATRAAAPA